MSEPSPKKSKHEGLRFNTGKLRYDLFEPYAMKELAKVFTKGAEKYAPNNWMKGMSWSSVNASLERHLQAWKSGEDVDEETQCLHMAQVAWNALALVSYKKIYPQGDDRNHSYLKVPKIGLDIDEVLADWIGHWRKWKLEKQGDTDTIQSTSSEDNSFRDIDPEFWNFDRHIAHRLKEIQENKEFWLTIPPKIDPKTLPFEPHCYITSRSIPTEWTEEWLDKNGFPGVKVFSVGFNKSKVQVAIDSGIDIFVDDRYENFVELNKAGICTFLWDAPHNRRYNVGYKRIKSLEELV
jgi:5'(3')-deoxyribonucleotidase